MQSQPTAILKRHVIALVAAFAALTAPGFSATAADKSPAPPFPTDTGAASIRALSDSFADVAARIRPCVVTIYSEKTVRMPRFRSPFGGNLPFHWFFGDEDRPDARPQSPFRFKQNGMGSGIVIDKEGHILTNNHVVDDMDDIKVKFADGSPLSAEVIGTDERTDLAVLKLKDKLPRDLAVATLGDSDALRVGDWVLAVGAPFGYEQTVTAGIISAKGRPRLERDPSMYGDLLQTDAAINPGNSGGPLVNLRGEVIGINRAIATQVGQYSGVGFAVPVNMAKHVLRDLIRSGKVTRGWLGVGIQAVTPELAEQFNIPETKGAVVTQVTKDSPAEKAGLKAGDTIVRFAGKSIDDSSQLSNLVADTAPGTKAELTVIRAGKERALTVTVGEWPEKTGKTPGRASAQREGSFGLTLEPLTADKARDLDYEGQTGVLVSAVKDGSPAEDAGIRPGDLITEANHQPVASLDDFSNALGKNKEKVLLLIRNKEGSRFAVLQTK